MGIRFNNPQRLDRPMSRQAFRPGQWNGVRVGGGNTYIQNNFYGMQTSYRGWNNMPGPLMTIQCLKVVMME